MLMLMLQLFLLVQLTLVLIQDLGLLVLLMVVRAWVNFNGTGTVAIRDSGNVSSITDQRSRSVTQLTLPLICLMQIMLSVVVTGSVQASTSQLMVDLGTALSRTTTPAVGSVRPATVNTCLC